MSKKEDENTRYYIDLDLKAGTIVGWDYDQRDKLAVQVVGKPTHRVFITKGQFNKLVKKHLDLFDT